jgi:hypothetical protein
MNGKKIDLSSDNSIHKTVTRHKTFLKSTIFWDITPCSPLKINRHFGGTYRLHLHGRSISRARNYVATCFHAGFLIGLFFDREDGGDMFLRNVG